MKLNYIIGNEISQEIGKELISRKYNYKKAALIWDRLINITYDMGDYFDYSQRQVERRLFLKGLTRNDKKIISLYLDYIQNYIDDFRGTKFGHQENELKKIALEIVFFTNENNL